MSDSLLISRDGPVTTLTLNRPAVRNAVDGATMLALRDAVEACAGDGTTRVIVLAGAGGAFCSGADLTLAAQPGISPEAACACWATPTTRRCWRFTARAGR